MEEKKSSYNPIFINPYTLESKDSSLQEVTISLCKGVHIFETKLSYDQRPKYWQEEYWESIWKYIESDIIRTTIREKSENQVQIDFHTPVCQTTKLFSLIANRSLYAHTDKIQTLQNHQSHIVNYNSPIQTYYYLNFEKDYASMSKKINLLESIGMIKEKVPERIIEQENALKQIRNTFKSKEFFDLCLFVNAVILKHQIRVLEIIQIGCNVVCVKGQPVPPSMIRYWEHIDFPPVNSDASLLVRLNLDEVVTLYSKQNMDGSQIPFGPMLGKYGCAVLFVEFVK
jgi:hypothetical protein